MARRNRWPHIMDLAAWWVGVGTLSLLLLLAMPWLGPWCHQWLDQQGYLEPRLLLRGLSQVPISIAPGPARQDLIEYTLDASNAQALVGLGQAPNQRWRDLADFAYSETFRQRFDYSDTSEQGPRVWLQYEPVGPTLCGRLELRRLKPNFAYQIKLKGDWRDPQAAEAIGYHGRWRLPGEGTNYTDEEFRAWPKREEVEAYLIFDFVVTDAQGNAVRDFALDASLHVLWQQRQYQASNLSHLVHYSLDVSNPAVYAAPEAKRVTRRIWAERESWRYQYAKQIIRLPTGTYQAKLALTEESFHDEDPDGGYWATVFEGDIQFTITAE